MILVRTGLALALLSFTLAVPGHAQSDSGGLHATFRAWADETWFLLLDRDAARGGRLSDQGILQRFQPTIDPDYQINLIRIRFGTLEDSDWYRHSSGARCEAGSLTTIEFAEECAFKQSVPVGRGWSADLHFDRANLPELTRSLTRIGFRRAMSGGAFLSIESTLVPSKPSTALEVGAGWRRPGHELALFVGDLGVLSNFIYGALGVEGVVGRDSARHYEQQPITLRLDVDQSFGKRWRLEARGGILLPSTIRAYVRFSPDSGFRQAERYEFASVLLEDRPVGRVTVGLFANYVEAVTDRTPLPDGRALDDFRLTERTAEAGALALVRLAPHWLIESWLARNWRPQWKVYRNGAAGNVDYEDAAWSGQTVLEYRPERGFGGSVAWDGDLRDVLRGAGQVPGDIEAPLGRHNNEIRLEWGWRAVNQYSFVMGFAIDTDPGTYPRGWFGGGEGRFELYW